jgi:hypothetical protein
MKKILSLLIIIGFIAFQGCNKDITDQNLDIKRPTSVKPEYLFSSAQRSYARLVATPNVNIGIWRLITQQWAQTTYIDESLYDLATRNITRSVWNQIYVGVVKDLVQASALVPSIEATAAEKKNMLAQIEIMKALAYYTLVVTFGDVPYNEAINIDNTKPKYDGSSAILSDLVSKLDKAISDLDANNSGFSNADLFCNGDISKWKKFANGVKLKIGITYADVDNAKAKSIVESASASGLLSSNEDNVIFTFSSVNPNCNPVWEDLVFSGRQDFVLSSVLVDKMNDLSDPRRAAYMTKVSGSYVGGVYGSNNNYNAYSHCSPVLTLPSAPAIVMDYSEVSFLLAEAAERGYNVGGSAQDHYNRAIEASFDYYNVAGYSSYIAQPSVAYTTASGDWKQKIGVQSWIALYNRGHESWTTWRRLDAPTLVAPTDAESDIPVRYPYSVDEQTLNRTNWQAASTAIGGDDVSTKLFWDKN